MMETWWGGSHPLPLQSGCAYFCSTTRRYWSSDCNVEKAYICETNPILPETETEPQTPETDELFPTIPGVKSELQSGAEESAHSMNIFVSLIMFGLMLLL